MIRDNYSNYSHIIYRILEFFNTNADDYHVVFTANATAALRLVAEHFDFSKDGNFHYCQENHTSVLGMRQLVRANGIYMLTPEQIQLNDVDMNSHSTLSTDNAVKSGNSLITFSAQCNFSGYKLPLTVIDKMHRHGLQQPGKCVWSKEQPENPENPAHNNNYYVCLDAASFAASSPLDLQRYRPDFVCISFYKIFGYPTGVGALLVSRRGAEVLHKRFYGGGTINYAYPHTMDHQLRDEFHQRFEDGTLPFLSIVELLQGFRTLERLVPGHSMERISCDVDGDDDDDDDDDDVEDELEDEEERPRCSLRLGFSFSFSLSRSLCRLRLLLRSSSFRLCLCLSLSRSRSRSRSCSDVSRRLSRLLCLRSELSLLVFFLSRLRLRLRLRRRDFSFGIIITTFKRLQKIIIKKTMPDKCVKKCSITINRKQLLVIDC